MTDHLYDVIVAGAGFAGAAAASAAAEAGLSVAVLEARERPGGRACTRRFGKTGRRLEFGGSWIAPWHHRIRHHVGVSNYRLRATRRVEERRWHDGASLLLDGPANPEEINLYEAGLSRLKADVRSLATGHDKDQLGLPLVDVTLNGYLHRIDASLPLRTQLMAWWCISGNGHPDRISAAELLSSCAHGDGSPEGMMQSLAHTIEPGAEDLVASMIASSGAELVLNAAIEEVRQFRSDVLVSCSNGKRYRARAMIVALPLNVLKTVRFAPSLERRKAQAIATGHGGRSFKLWMKVTGVRPGILVTGGLSGVQWAFVEREDEDGATYIVSFGLMDGLFDPSSGRDVENGLKRFFPEARLLEWDWHDWVSDPCARGTWLAIPANAPWIADAEAWRNESRLFFASADFAPGAPGWFESAIVAGETAAAQLLHAFAGA